MKNYFTDEQVIELTGEALPHTKDMILTKKCLGEFRKLMNLAVETAIGEPIVHLWENEPNGDAVYSNNTQPKPSDAIPLYSVKELEN